VAPNTFITLFLEARKEAVAELAEVGLSNVKIADVLGVSDETVRRAKQSTNVESEKGKPSETLEPENEVTTNVEPPARLLEIRRMDFRELLSIRPQVLTVSTSRTGSDGKQYPAHRDPAPPREREDDRETDVT